MRKWVHIAVAFVAGAAIAVPATVLAAGRPGAAAVTGSLEQQSAFVVNKGVVHPGSMWVKRLSEQDLSLFVAAIGVPGPGA